MIAGEYLLQQDRQRPAIEHDVVISQHNPVAVFCGADQSHPKGRRLGEVADRGAFGGAQPLDLLVGVRVVPAEVDIPPGRHGIGRDDLHRLVELSAESGGQVGMTVDHGVHCIAQPVGVEWAGHGDVQLHRIQVVVIGAVLVPAWKSSPCCIGVSGSTSAIRYCWCSSSICCWLRRAGAISDGVSPPPPCWTWAQMPARASNHSWLSRVIWV